MKSVRRKNLGTWRQRLCGNPMKQPSSSHSPRWQDERARSGGGTGSRSSRHGAIPQSKGDQRISETIDHHLDEACARPGFSISERIPKWPRNSWQVRRFHYRRTVGKFIDRNERHKNTFCSWSRAKTEYHWWGIIGTSLRLQRVPLCGPTDSVPGHACHGPYPGTLALLSSPLPAEPPLRCP